MTRDHFWFLTSACVHDAHDECEVICRYCGEVCMCLCHHQGKEERWPLS